MEKREIRSGVITLQRSKKIDKLPIELVLEDIKNTLLAQDKLILQAPPGAGKSTRVPLALLDAPYLKNKMIVMLEPRRVAARMVATQMASLLGETLGERVGYRVKMESAFSQKTKILVVTEAILVRMLQADETLEGVGLVIFDEFHERNIYSDLSLALSLQVQELLREDLKLLIMSATLHTQKLLTLLPDTPCIRSEGRSYPISYSYLDIKEKQVSRQTLYKTLLQVLKNDTGDILVFLQGVQEIRELQKMLIDSLDGSVAVLPLYSALAKKEQDRALHPLEKRKIILATNIAQTSLTIEGVRVVVDSGLEKRSTYNHANAMNHLESVFISQDAATQRAGRAGRLEHGKCYRVWHENKALVASSKPEILRADLMPLCLELAQWGVVAFEELTWLDLPPKELVLQTQTILQELAMLDDNFQITSFGREALHLGVHPRLAYMVLQGKELGYAYEASLLCALLGQKDIFNNSFHESDISLHFEALLQKDVSAEYSDSYTVGLVLQEANLLYRKLKKLSNKTNLQKHFSLDFLSVLLLFAYPDRLAKRREKDTNKYKLSNGKGVLLSPQDTLLNEEYLVVANLNASANGVYIRQALAISLEKIEEYFATFITTQEYVSYNKESKKFVLREQRSFLDLVLDVKILPINEKYEMQKLLSEYVNSEGVRVLPWGKKVQNLCARVNFLNHHVVESLESLQERDLLEKRSVWLEPYLSGVKNIKGLEKLDTYRMLLSMFSWEEQQRLEVEVPTHIQVPSGSQIALEYGDIEKPVLRVKIQEMFGLRQLPKLLNETVAIQIHLLSPAMRVIQITYDLESFWENSYEEVRKELRGKYKRHYWPENPHEAVATNKTKKQLSTSS